MIEFSKTTLGSKRLVALTAKSTEGSGKELIIQKIKKLNVKKIVSRHEVFHPFSTYFCHMLSSTEIYAVDVDEPKTKNSSQYNLCNMSYGHLCMVIISCSIQDAQALAGKR